jgi:hypothetical protein
MFPDVNLVNTNMVKYDGMQNTKIAVKGLSKRTILCPIFCLISSTIRKSDLDIIFPFFGAPLFSTYRYHLLPRFCLRLIDRFPLEHQFGHEIGLVSDLRSASDLIFASK